MSKARLKSTPILLMVINLFSFWLRGWGIQFGLPFAYHPDEQQYIWPAIRSVSGNFQPQAHYNPALYPYLIGVVYTLTYLGLKLFNAFPAYFDLDTALSESMQPWLTGLFYLARYTSVATGVLTTLVVYQLGRRAYSRETGLGAAVIFGLTFCRLLFTVGHHHPANVALNLRSHTRRPRFQPTRHPHRGSELDLPKRPPWQYPGR